MNLNRIDFICCYFNQFEELYTHIFTNAIVDDKNYHQIVKTAEEIWKFGITKVKHERHILTFKVSMNFDKSLIKAGSNLIKINKLIKLSDNYEPIMLIHHKFPQVVPKKVINKIKKQQENINLIDPIKVSVNDLSRSFLDSVSVCSVETEDFGEMTSIRVDDLKKSEFTKSVEQPITNNVESVVDEESLRNIEMLKSISFLHDNNFYIIGDKAMLLKRVGCAFGDYIKNRGGENAQRGYRTFRISRIGISDL